MTNEMLARIKALPLTFPYANYKALKSIPSIDARANAMMEQLTQEQADAYGIDVDHLPEIVVAKWQAAKYFVSFMKDKGLPALEIAKTLDIDRSAVSWVYNAKRPLSFYPESLQTLCYEIFHESCHKVMFGEEGRIKLPNIFSVMARYLLLLPNEEMAVLCGIADRTYEECLRMAGSQNNGKRIRSYGALFNERIHNITFECARTTSLLFGSQGGAKVNGSLHRIFRNNQDSITPPKLTFNMFLALETGYALDYFVAEDFTKYVDCYYDDGKNLVLLENRMVLKFIGICLALDEPDRVKLCSYAWEELYKTIFKMGYEEANNAARALSSSKTANPDDFIPDAGIIPKVYKRHMTHIQDTNNNQV